MMYAASHLTTLLLGHLTDSLHSARMRVPGLLKSITLFRT